MHSELSLLNSPARQHDRSVAALTLAVPKSTVHTATPEWVRLADFIGKQDYVNRELVAIFLQMSRFNAVYQSQRTLNVVKRVTDIVFASAGIVCLAPFMALVAVLIKLTSKGPVLYTQTRVGKDFQFIRVLKFRTMLHGAPVDLNLNEMKGALFKARNDPRVTRFGRLLRRMSVDELPQLVNILLGDMTFVGPRPLTVEQSATVPVRLYDRFAVRPGLTGLWQARCRESRNSMKKLRLDYLYVQRRSIFLDIYILMKTVVTVISGRGAW